jgi:shikimate kinase
MIVLIGMPGSGKSTVGRSLARRMQLPFADSDTVIEQRLAAPSATTSTARARRRFATSSRR